MRAYYNGIIHTMRRDVSAMAIENGRVLAVGSDAEILALAGNAIDLKGLCVVPGFNDSHCHMLSTGLVNAHLDLRSARSNADVIRLARAFIEERKVPEGEYVLGYGFDNNLFDDGMFPDIRVADAISTRHPVMLERVCGHAGTLNTLALQKLGFDKNTEMQGGRLHKYLDGELNGIICETVLTYAMDQVDKPRGESLKEALVCAMREYNRRGVTSVQTDDLETVDYAELRTAYSGLRAENRMTLRVSEELQAPNPPELKRLIDMGAKTGMGDELFRVVNVKIIADGSLGAHTAHMLKPYNGGADRGLPLYTDAEIFELAQTAAGAGLQIAFHTIGDAAVSQCVNAIERLPENDRRLRHRLVHAQFLSAELLERIARAGMCVDMQPAFTASDWYLVEPLLGSEYAKYSYCWRSMLNAGIRIAAGSDSPVESPDPIWGMYCAVTRKDAFGRPEGGYMPCECLSPREALALYTTGGAYNAFEEGIKGTLEPGMLADFTVLSADPISIPHESIRDIRVLETYIGGECCYQV